ncbi:MAG: thioredoxin [Candidatus Omnitrophica bacterium]|nr:thioredoxin [Candidatus Omnitrophota bacterium]
MVEKLVEITDANFEAEITRSDTPCVLDFWAEWCGPCQMLTPVMHEIAGIYQDKIKVGKVNVDRSPRLASRFGIMSIPSLLFMKDGEVIEKSVGVVSKKEIEKRISNLLEQ